jgi:hypothetical protein
MANPPKDTYELRGRVPASTYFAFQALLLNPATSKPYYGGVGLVLEVLVNNFIRHLSDEFRKGIPVNTTLLRAGITLPDGELNGSAFEKALRDAAEKKKGIESD